MDLELIGGFLAVFAAVFYALRFYFIRKTTSARGIIYVMIVSYMIGSLIFVPVSIFLNYPNFELSQVDAFIFIGAGLLMIPVQYCLYEGIRRIGASRSAPIFRGAMLVASLIGVIFLGETVGTLHLVGVTLLFLGVVLVSYESSEKSSDTNSILSLNLIFPLVAMLMAGFVSPLISLGFARGVPVTVGLAIHRLTAFVGMVLLFGYKGWRPLRPFHAQERMLYIGAGIALSVAGVCTFLALSIAPVSVVIPLRGMSPLFVLIVSYFYLKKLETITKSLVIGAILTVLGGVLIGIFM